MILHYPVPPRFPVSSSEEDHIARREGWALDFGRNGAEPIDGQSALACHAGHISAAFYDPGDIVRGIAGGGNMVYLAWRDDATDTLYRARYAHLREPCPFAVGTEVNAGSTIGFVGNTGWAPFPMLPHLHFVLEYFTGVWARVRPSEWLDIAEDNATAGSGVGQEQNLATNEATLTDEQRAVIQRAIDVLTVNNEQRLVEINLLVQQAAVSQSPEVVALLSGAVDRITVLHDEVAGETHHLREVLE